jgi:hypothetical protein
MVGMENTAGFISTGTSLEPRTAAQSSPMIHHSFGDWVFMFHGNAFLVNTQQSGPRGGDKTYGVNWAMPMLARRVGRQSVSVRTMISLDPVTVTHRRYPLLFQTGEIAFGRRVVDGQHPHDLVMELAVRYDFSLNDDVQLFAYGGPVGGPALGPAAFPHRSSASENPAAVLGHHMQDSTHVSNSVITMGLSGGPLQLEASAFSGREPNENRWNFDGGRPDSFASRLTLAAGAGVTGQFSAGRINNREEFEPDLDTLRITASIHHHRRFQGGHIASSLIWGRNKDMDEHGRRILNAYTLESTVHFRNNNWVWTRIENTDRDRTLLAGETSAHVDEDPIGRVQAYTFGYTRDLPGMPQGLRLGLGAQVTAYGLTPQLKAIYGPRPAAISMFLRLRPQGNLEAAHHAH